MRGLELRENAAFCCIDFVIGNGVVFAVDLLYNLLRNVAARSVALSDASGVFGASLYCRIKRAVAGNGAGVECVD
jgi:hypothetical protein